jgi:hypothetical protein
MACRSAMLASTAPEKDSSGLVSSSIYDIMSVRRLSRRLRVALRRLRGDPRAVTTALSPTSSTAHTVAGGGRPTVDGGGGEHPRFIFSPKRSKSIPPPSPFFSPAPVRRRPGRALHRCRPGRALHRRPLLFLSRMCSSSRSAACALPLSHRQRSVRRVLILAAVWALAFADHHRELSRVVPPGACSRGRVAAAGVLSIHTPFPSLFSLRHDFCFSRS